MALRLTMTSRHRQTLGDSAIKEFGHDGGTIGRSLESDWVLPDSQRYVSSRHASIDYRSGSYYIVDSSTNGVYVNDSETPVGRGNPQRLFTGDRIRLGEYEMTVEILDEDDTMETLTDDRHVDPVERAKRVPPPDPTRADLIQPHEITSIGIEMLISDDAEAESLKRAAQLSVANLRLEDDPVPKREVERPAAEQPQRVAAPHAAARAPAQASQPPAQTPPQPRVAPSASNSLLTSTGTGQQIKPPPAPRAGANAVLEPFFRGAGVQAQRLDERQTELVLHALGQMMREVIVGIGENLHLRSEQRNALHVANAQKQPEKDNPLKAAAGVEEALASLLLHASSEQLAPVDAVREALIDVKVHQQSLFNALRRALADYLARLDPDEIETKYTNGKRGGLMSAANKLKYWDLYKDLYQVVAQQSAGQLPQLFKEDLSRAYEHESARSGGSQARKPQAKLAT